MLTNAQLKNQRVPLSASTPRDRSPVSAQPVTVSSITSASTLTSVWTTMRVPVAPHLNASTMKDRSPVNVNPVTSLKAKTVKVLN